MVRIFRRLTVRLVSAAVLGALMLSLSAEPPAAAPAIPSKVVLAPHRAVYRMTLRSARNSSKIADVRGAMMYEQADVCDGWTTEQRFQLRFVYAEGDEMDMVTNYTTWEAKNGLRYRFNVRKLVNGDTDEEIRGSARLKSKGGSGDVHYLMPDTQRIPLGKGSLFPTAHTIALLERAQRNERFFNRVVFDGADADGATEVSAVIGPGRPADVNVDSPLLREQTAWPIRMAFFPMASASETPEYELSMRLLGNGVIGGMQIDYGDFIVDAVLERVEAMPKPRC
jgi:hypothetical protein